MQPRNLATWFFLAAIFFSHTAGALNKSKNSSIR